MSDRPQDRDQKPERPPPLSESQRKDAGPLSSLLRFARGFLAVLLMTAGALLLLPGLCFLLFGFGMSEGQLLGIGLVILLVAGAVFLFGRHLARRN